MVRDMAANKAAGATFFASGGRILCLCARAGRQVVVGQQDAGRSLAALGEDSPPSDRRTESSASSPPAEIFCSRLRT